MSLPRPASRRGILILLLLLVAIIGTVNISLRRQLPFRVAREGYHVVISGAVPESGVRDGDHVHAINGAKIHGLPEASWMLSWIPPHAHATLALSRGDSVFAAAVSAESATPLLYILLDRLTGLVFVALGLLVWWHAQSDETVLAFARVNLVIGSAALLNDFPSVFSSPTVQVVYAVAYLSVRSLVPAALIDFIYRFTSGRQSSSAGRFVSWVFYGLAAVAVLTISVSVVMAHLTSQTVWMLRFDVLNRLVYGSWLLLAVTLAIVRLSFAALREKTPWHRRQLRWLLICLFIGATPYVLLEKLPTLWGWSPFIPPDLAMAMLMITPIGWAMAVASFHMLRVQWNLSRTFVYVVTAGITIYTVAGLVALSSALVRHDLVTYTPLLLLFALVLVTLLSRALVDGVQWAVDRVFFGDWFDYRRATREIQIKLSNCLRVQDIVPVLTDEIASILKVDKGTLVVRKGDLSQHVSEGDWCVLSRDGTEVAGPWPSFSPPDREVPSAEPIASPAGYGYVLAVPLTHAETTRGWLLLGQKSSGAPFSHRDRQLLNFLSPVAGMALANVELHRRLTDRETRMVVIELAGGIAHEISNALTPLMGQAQLLESALQHSTDSLPRATVSPPLKIITDMCARIRRIVQNLSRLSQPVVLEESIVDLNDVAEDAIQLMSETAGRIKHYRTESDDSEVAAYPYQLRRELCANIPTVRGDRQLLSQVFINLILNAADAMESQGKGVLTLGTCVSVDPPGILSFVRDTGPGIPAGSAEKLFLPYFTTKPRDKGTGLGLSLVRSIIEAHHGWIAVRSPADGGARFEFFLPASFSGDRLHSR